MTEVIGGLAVIGCLAYMLIRTMNEQAEDRRLKCLINKWHKHYLEKRKLRHGKN